MTRLIGGEFAFNDYQSVKNIGAGSLFSSGGRIFSPAKGDTASNNARGGTSNDYYGLAFSPDNRYLFSGRNSSPFLAVFDMNDNTFTDLSVIPVPPLSNVWCVEFNADGSKIAVGSTSSPFITLYNWPAGTQISTPASLPAGRVKCAAWSPDGAYLALGLAVSPWVEIYNVSTWAKITPTWGTPFGAAVSSVKFSPDSSRLYAISDQSTSNGRLRVWNPTTGALIFSDVSSTLGTARMLDVSPDGSKLVVMRSAGLYVYNTSSWAAVAHTETPAEISGMQGFNRRGCQLIDNDFVMCYTTSGVSLYDIANSEIVYSTALFETQPTYCYTFRLCPLTVVRKLAGVVTDSLGAFASRTVRAYDSASGRKVGETVSDPITGEFSMIVLTSEHVTVFAIGTGGENAKIYNPVTPAAWP